MQKSVTAVSEKPIAKQKVYRWKDEDGKWQYSNVAPSDQQVQALKLIDNFFKSPKTGQYSANKQSEQKNRLIP